MLASPGNARVPKTIEKDNDKLYYDFLS